MRYKTTVMVSAHYKKQAALLWIRIKRPIYLLTLLLLFGFFCIAISNEKKENARIFHFMLIGQLYFWASFFVLTEQLLRFKNKPGIL